LRAAIEASALARGVTGHLPIVLWPVHGDFVAAKQDGSIRWHEAKDALGGGLDLIVIADASFGQSHEHRKLVLALAAVTSAVNCPVLVSVGELPSSQADCAEVILETTVDDSGNVLTLAKSGDGAKWSRKFSFERISLGGVETRVIKPGAPTEFRPFHPAPAPAPAPVPEPELPIVSRLVYPITGDTITDAERARWPGHGWVFSQSEIISAVEGNKNLGRTEIVIAFGSMGGSAQPEVNRIKTALLGAELAKFAIVTASEQRLLPAW
jgi:hypothetical protein